MTTTVYRLRDDAQKLQMVQQATLNTEAFGYQQTHGLFGSPEWWNNIATGKLRLHTARGQISKVYLSGTRDWPEFKMLTHAGEELSWTRESQNQELDAAYVEGAPIEVDYVVQIFKQKAPLGPTESKCVVEVRIEHEQGNEA